MARLSALLLVTLTLASSSLAMASTQHDPSPFSYITANLLAQLLVLLLLLFGSCVGILCLLKIDTPTVFSDKPLVINKEY